jgi:hypothetical protein
VRQTLVLKFVEPSILVLVHKAFQEYILLLVFQIVLHHQLLKYWQGYSVVL